MTTAAAPTRRASAGAVVERKTISATGRAGTSAALALPRKCRAIRPPDRARRPAASLQKLSEDPLNEPVASRQDDAHRADLQDSPPKSLVSAAEGRQQ